MVEFVTINDTLNRERIKSALDCCGFDFHSDDWHKLSPEAKRTMIADSFVAYGYCDFENPAEVYQPDRSQPDKFDGWQAERMSWTNIYKLLRRKCANL